MIPVVLDTNVLVSATFWNGNPRKLLEVCKNGKLRLVLSPDILYEFKHVLETEKKFKLTKQQIKHLINSLLSFSYIVFPSKKLKVVSPDASDNAIIECAVEGFAVYIISGDRDLTSVGSYGRIKILKPSEAVKKLL